MAIMDPIWFREETKKKSRRLVWSSPPDPLKLFARFLVRSQMFVRERLVTLGPDLAAAHFLCFKYSPQPQTHPSCLISVPELVNV